MVAMQSTQSGGMGWDDPGFGPNEWLVEEMYERYLADPSSVDAAWHEFCTDYKREQRAGATGAGLIQRSATPAEPTKVTVHPLDGGPASSTTHDAVVGALAGEQAASGAAAGSPTATRPVGPTIGNGSTVTAATAPAPNEQTARAATQPRAASAAVQPQTSERAPGLLAA